MNKQSFGLLFCLTATVLASPVWAAGDAKKGADVFAEECGDCHSTIAGKNKKGPSLNGVFGRKAGTAEGFDYSPALRSSAIVWTEAALDRWLANPESLVRGQKMGVSVANAQDRADLVAYLKAASAMPKPSR